MTRQILAACVAVATTAFAQAIYVSPAGNDANPGTRGETIGDLAEGVAGRSGSKSENNLAGSRRIRNLEGLSLDAETGGTAEAPLVIRSEIPLQAKITGGKRVVGFRPISADEAKTLISAEAKQQVLVADLQAQGFPTLQKMPAQFRAPGCEEVVFGDQPMQSARWPNEGFTAFTEVIDAGASDPIHWVTRKVYRPGSFRFPNDRAKHWDISRGVYLHGFWCYNWADEALKVASYNAETKELRFAVKHGYGIGSPRGGKSERNFYALHVFEELDCPGEYYPDRTAGKLYFWPPSDITKTPVYVSLCPKPLLTATNVTGLLLRDLVFENGSDWGVILKGCQHARIENCLVRNMALGGISSSGGSDNHVLRCEVTRTGSVAVSMSAGNRKTLTRGNCSVVGNHLHHLGRYDWMGGRGVTIGGCGNRAANNLIHHCPTGGVSYGGNEHLLELNEVHHVCLLYSDVGVFYTGRDWASRGNIVRWNFIHSNANNHGLGSQAIYLDDCDSGDTVVGNIIYGGVGRSVLLGGGRDNTIRGNIFIDTPKGIHIDARGPRGITLDKPGSWNLKAKCEALDYLSPLWKERYPRLARVLDEDPLLPLGNVFHQNIFIGVKQPFAPSRDVKEEWLDKKDNLVLEMAEFPFLPADSSTAPLDLDQLPKIWKKLPGFEPIPFEKIGPNGL